MSNTTTIGDVVARLDSLFRPELQEDYDNAGFLLGDSHWPYHGALVSLDLTPQVADEACQRGANLIVTHHPFIFGGVRRLTDRSETGRLVQQLCEQHIAVYAAHTNLDNLAWGVNDALARKLGIVQCRILHPLQNEPTAGAGMVGELATPTVADDFLQHAKQVLGIPILRCSPHDPQQPLHRVAICGGAGSSFIADALHAHADLYLTADLKYHDFQRTNQHMILADCGHYETEQFAREIIFGVLSENFSNFACCISEKQQSIVAYM